MKKKQKRKLNVFTLIGEALLWALALFCVSISIVSTIDTHTNYSCSYFGYRTSVIISKSMANANPENTYLDESMTRIDKYDVITAKEVKYDDIQLYDVVLHLEGNSLICHRVVDKYEDNGTSYLVTRGDANNVNDAPFAYSLCRGKVVNVVPKIGEVVLFFQSGYFFLALFVSVLLVAGTLFTLSLLSDKKKAKTIAQTSSNLDVIDQEIDKEESKEEKNDN